jgi:hypothetical protein
MQLVRSFRATTVLALLACACGESAVTPQQGDGGRHDVGAQDAGAQVECRPASQLVRSGRYLVVGEQASGIDECGGSWLRREALTCNPIGPGDACSPENAGACVLDSDCTGRERGTCLDDWDQGCFCSYACNTDADCRTNELCLCPAGIRLGEDEELHLNWQNECVPAACRTATDCGGKGCVMSPSCCGDVEGFYCKTERDECNSDADCDHSHCTYDVKRALWACGETCTCE